MSNIEEERSRRLELIKPHVLQVFHDFSKGWDWLKQPNPALGWAKPYDLLTTDEGEYGVYS